MTEQTEPDELSEFQSKIAAGGLTALEAMRDYVAAALENAGNFREKGPLIRRLENIVGEIDRIRAQNRPDDPIELIKQRRDTRRSKK